MNPRKKRFHLFDGMIAEDIHLPYTNEYNLVRLLCDESTRFGIELIYI